MYPTVLEVRLDGGNEIKKVKPGANVEVSHVPAGPQEVLLLRCAFVRERSAPIDAETVEHTHRHSGVRWAMEWLPGGRRFFITYVWPGLPNEGTPPIVSAQTRYPTAQGCRNLNGCTRQHACYCGVNDKGYSTTLSEISERLLKTSTTTATVSTTNTNVSFDAAEHCLPARGYMMIGARQVLLPV